MPIVIMSDSLVMVIFLLLEQELKVLKKIEILVI